MKVIKRYQPHFSRSAFVEQQQQTQFRPRFEKRLHLYKGFTIEENSGVFTIDGFPKHRFTQIEMVRQFIDHI